jgi:hypothetical protein
MGIFMNYQGTYECVVNVDGQDWLVGVEDIRMMETEDGKTYTN